MVAALARDNLFSLDQEALAIEFVRRNIRFVNGNKTST
jgi:hypothetical protein